MWLVGWEDRTQLDGTCLHTLSLAHPVPCPCWASFWRNMSSCPLPGPSYTVSLLSLFLMEHVFIPSPWAILYCVLAESLSTESSETCIVLQTKSQHPHSHTQTLLGLFWFLRVRFCWSGQHKLVNFFASKSRIARILDFAAIWFLSWCLSPVIVGCGQL